MPRYHCLDTEVQLCTWGPVSCQSILLESSVPVTRISATDSYSPSAAGSDVQRDTSNAQGRNLQYSHDHSHSLTALTEEYFKEREGLDYLGRDTPFYLVHARYGSSSVTRPVAPWLSTYKSRYQDPELSPQSLEDFIGNRYLRGNSTADKAKPDVPLSHSTASEGHQQENGPEAYSSSGAASLSNLSSTGFVSQHLDLRSEESQVEKGGKSLASPMTPTPPKTTANDLRTPFQTARLESMTQPIQVIVKLSEKSFISPIYNSDRSHYDLCINIFYNGEFNASQIIEYSVWAADKGKNQFNFGSRRIEIYHELPRVINIKSEDAHSTMSLDGEHTVFLQPLERWDKLMQKLCLEAREWGRDKRGYRCPTVEYLELLSKETMPPELNSSQLSTGSCFGVIDVVITLGRVLHQDVAKEISSPRLPQKTCMLGGAQIRSKIATTFPSAIDLPANLSVPTVLGGFDPFAMKVDSKDTSKSSSKTDIPNSITNSSRQVGQVDLGDLGDKTKTASVTIHNIDSELGREQAKSTEARNPAALASAPIPRPPHPYRPENVPQKTYRGNEPILPPSKRQKTVKSFEELPFDLNTAAYMSTRARRSASTPFAQPSLKPQPESSAKRKRGVIQVKSILPNTGASEKSTMENPLTPKNEKMNIPKTPNSGGALKKRPRSSNFNPKLSNRPQNLRRKNSAGEWIIPPCRRNSSGEWETPTKGGQVKAAGFFGEHALRTATGQNGKVVQPTFITPPKDRLHLSIGQDTTDRNQPNKDEITVEDNINPANYAVKAKGVTLAVPVNENKREEFLPYNPAEQSDKVVLTGVTHKPTNSTPGATCHGVKNPRTPVKSSQNQELRTASPTSAGAIAFGSYFQEKKDSNAFGVSKSAGKKRTLRMRFFEGNVDPDGKIVGDGCGNKRWLVRRCTVLSLISASGRVENLAIDPILRKPAFSTGPKGPKVTDILTDSATAGQRRKLGTSNMAGLSAWDNSVIATLRDSRAGTPHQVKLPTMAEPLPRFMATHYKPIVLKIVNRKQVATETDGVKQEAQRTTIEGAGHIHINERFGRGPPNYLDGINSCDSQVLATPNGPQRSLRRDARLKTLSTPRADHLVLLDGSASILAQSKNILGVINEGGLLIQEDQASVKTPAGRIHKRPIHPRTVGSTELKALLEIHDRHNVVNTSPYAPLVTMHSQPMTRASRKATCTSEAVADTPTPSDKTTVKLSIASNSAPRKRSCAGQLIEKSSIAVIAPEYTKNTVRGASQSKDAHTSKKNNYGTSNIKAKKPPLTTHGSSTTNATVITTVEGDLGLLGTGEFSPSGIPAVQKLKKTVSRQQNVLDIPKKQCRIFWDSLSQALIS